MILKFRPRILPKGRAGTTLTPTHLFPMEVKEWKQRGIGGMPAALIGSTFNLRDGVKGVSPKDQGQRMPEHFDHT